MKMKKILIVVDMQGDFACRWGVLYFDGAEAVVRPISDFLKTLDPSEYAAVIFTFDTHHRETYGSMPESEQFAIHCIRGEKGWDLQVDPESVTMGIPVYAIEKGVFDMYEEDFLPVRTIRAGDVSEAGDRDSLLGDLRAVADKAVIVGLAADYCVRDAVKGTHARGFEVEVPAGMTRGISRQIDEVLVDLGIPA